MNIIVKSQQSWINLLDLINGHWKHYVLCDYENSCLPIRIPGGTLGSIEYDENKVITKIHVCTDYVVKTYPDDVNEQLKKFIGQKIEIGD